jgi:stress-induced-phosphoprotein 1
MSNKAAAEAKAKGNAFFLKKQYPEAIDWYTKAIKADPHDSTFYSNRCAAYMGLDKFQEALGDAEMCIKLQPAWVKGWYRKGAALMSLSRYEEAAMAFRKGIEYEPQNDDLKGRLEEAERQAKYAPKRFKDDGSALSPAELAKEEGNALFRNAKYEEAIQKYGRAITLATTEEEKATYYTNRATCYAQLHHHKEVVEDTTAAINIKPSSKAYIRRGLAYESLEKYKLGLEDMKKAMELDPGAIVASQAMHRLTRAVNSL